MYPSLDFCSESYIACLPMILIEVLLCTSHDCKSHSFLSTPRPYTNLSIPPCSVVIDSIKFWMMSLLLNWIDSAKLNLYEKVCESSWILRAFPFNLNGSPLQPFKKITKNHLNFRTQQTFAYVILWCDANEYCYE